MGYLLWGAGGALAVVENGALKLSGSGNESDPEFVIPDDLTRPIIQI